MDWDKITDVMLLVAFILTALIVTYTIIILKKGGML